MVKVYCGEDFCELCGDCLRCFGEDPCLENTGGDGNGEHAWPEEEIGDTDTDSPEA